MGNNQGTELVENCDFLMTMELMTIVVKPEILNLMAQSKAQDRNYQM